MKKIFALLFAILFTSVASSQTLPLPTVAAKSWLLLDMTSNQIIGSKNPTLRIEPASLAKIMTAYVTFSALRDRRISEDQMIEVSVKAWKVDPSSSKMFISPATAVSIRDLLYGLMVVSGNDAAVALAEAVAGTESSFVALMNQEAKKMGMSRTHFGNPHGLPSTDTYSTARDLATLAVHVINDFPEFYKIDSTKRYTYNKITQFNRNRLLWSDPTVDGMKTGYTSSAGYSIIVSAKHKNSGNSHRLLAVVIGTNSDRIRIQEARKLLNWGFQNFDAIKICAKSGLAEKLRIWKGDKNYIKIGFKKNLYVTVQRGMAKEIESTLERTSPLIAPVKRNSQIGMFKIKASGVPIAQFPVVALESINKAGILGRAWDSMRMLFK